MSKQYAKVSLMDDEGRDDFDPRRKDLPPPAVPGGIELTSSNATSTSSSSPLPSPSSHFPTLSRPPSPSRHDSTASSFIDDTESTELIDHSTPDGSSSESAPATTSSSSGVAGLIILDPNPASEGEITIQIMRLGGTGHGNVQLNVGLNATISSVISRVYERELSEGAQVRIVFMGRRLTGEEKIMSVGIRDGNVLHSLVVSAEAVATQQAASSHMVGPNQMREVQIDPNTGMAVPVAPPANFGAMAIADGGGYPGNTPLDGSVMYSDRQLYLMREAQEHAYTQRQGTNGDLMLGMLVGFVLGFISIILLVNANTSRRMRLGIIIGLVINIFVSLRNMNEESKTTSDSQPRVGHGPPGIADPLGPVGNSR